MINENTGRSGNGKWVVLALIVLSLIVASLRWAFVPKTNPRNADPGNPFYSKPKVDDDAPKPAGDRK